MKILTILLLKDKVTIIPKAICWLKQVQWKITLKLHNSIYNRSVIPCNVLIKQYGKLGQIRQWDRVVHIWHDLPGRQSKWHFLTLVSRDKILGVKLVSHLTYWKIYSCDQWNKIALKMGNYDIWYNCRQHIFFLIVNWNCLV